MADPTAYSISYSFSGYQANSPDDPLPADELDNELQAIETSIDSLVTGLMDIRASDGGLKNGIVEVEHLSVGLLTGIKQPTKWATATAYEARDTVFSGPKYYICLVAHTSGTFATDLAAAKWSELADFTPTDIVAAANVTYDNATSGLTATDTQAAIDEVEARLATVEAGAGGEDEIGEDDLSAALALKILTPGMLMDYAGTVAPSGWLLCHGQAVSRTTYSDLFDAIGTTWGAGDSSTTFNVPDLRGRVTAGKDDMGGTSANRLTGLTGGIDGDGLGNVGGAESHTLTTAQLASHAHVASASNDPSHSHTTSIGYKAVNDPGGTGLNALVKLGDSADANSSFPSSTQGVHTHTITVATAGSGAGHNNVQPTVIANKIIFSGVA